LVGRPVRPEVFKNLCEDEKEWGEMAGHITDLILSGRIEVVDEKLVLR
jgi:hypothetical protein